MSAGLVVNLTHVTRVIASPAAGVKESLLAHCKRFVLARTKFAAFPTFPVTCVAVFVFVNAPKVGLWESSPRSAPS
jgi:hypothetical protein